MSEPLYLEPQAIIDGIKGACGSAVRYTRASEWAEGASRKVSRQVWIRLDREALRPALEWLVRIDYPHLGVISCCDTGQEIELLYHLFIYHSRPHREIMVTFTVPVPKTDPTVPTITDIIPGALTSEREKQEMIGVQVTGIPDNRRMFLPEDFPGGVFPWRKDEKGVPAEMVKELWRTGRQETGAAVAPAATPDPT